MRHPRVPQTKLAADFFRFLALVVLMTGQKTDAPAVKTAAHQAREAARMVRVEGKSLREVAHHYHVGHSTIVRALGRAEA